MCFLVWGVGLKLLMADELIAQGRQGQQNLLGAQPGFPSIEGDKQIHQKSTDYFKRLTSRYIFISRIYVLVVMVPPPLILPPLD